MLWLTHRLTAQHNKFSIWNYFFCSHSNQEVWRRSCPWMYFPRGRCVAPPAIRLAVHHGSEVRFSICRRFLLTSHRDGFVGCPHRHVRPQGAESLTLHNSLVTFGKPHSWVVANQQTILICWKKEGADMLIWANQGHTVTPWFSIHIETLHIIVDVWLFSAVSTRYVYTDQCWLWRRKHTFLR
jgi:hypothetical protein